MKISLEPTTNFELDWYSNSKLVAMDTCHRWGAISFGERLAFASNSRSMALEAGSASHDGFAALRLYELGSAGHVDHMRHRARELYGDGRDGTILQHFDKYADAPTCALNMVLEAFGTSGYYDDPRDRRRTMSNIEEALTAYTGRYPINKYPIWVEDANDPTKLVGIELFFDLTTTIDLEDGTEPFTTRYIGTLDGLHYTSNDPEEIAAPKSLLLGENKTGARLDETWRTSFETSHQVTGYMIAATALTGVSCVKGIVRGMAIPLPRTYDLGGIVNEVVHRKHFQFEEWFRWFMHSAKLFRTYAGDPLSAPMMTHSCNRYFRPCAFIPICASDPEEKEQMLSEMVPANLSPSEEAMLSKHGD